ncbi:MAG: NDP-sugar synthase [Patescibacteria group bacterium]
MSNKITQAVILSAGFGTRLRAVTEKMNIPKVMAPLLSKPLLEWHIEALKKSGIREFFVNLHYLPGVIINYFGNGLKWKVKINYAFEKPEILGTAGGIKNFEDILGDNFFVLYGDTFYEIDYGEIERFYFSRDNAIGAGTVRKTDHPLDSDLAVLGENDRVARFLLKPHQGELLARLESRSESGGPENYWGMSAPYIFSKKILEFIPPKTYYEIDHQLVPDLLGRGYNYYAYKLQKGEFRKDIGTPERYREVEEYLKKKQPLS